MHYYIFLGEMFKMVSQKSTFLQSVVILSLVLKPKDIGNKCTLLRKNVPGFFPRFKNVSNPKTKTVRHAFANKFTEGHTTLPSLVLLLTTCF